MESYKITALVTLPDNVLVDVSATETIDEENTITDIIYVMPETDSEGIPLSDSEKILVDMKMRMYSYEVISRNEIKDCAPDYGRD